MCSRYAEEVESRLRSIGLVCNIGYPRDDVPITEIIERIARTGTLYAVLVTEQNAQHRSCTLNILNGPRQGLHCLVWFFMSISSMSIISKALFLSHFKAIDIEYKHWQFKS